MPDPTVRPAADGDITAITAIYAHYVRHGLSTFEEIVPSEEQMAERRAHVLAEGMPFLVAERASEVVGYAYATVYRGRSAYRYTAEDSIYVHHAHAGSGIGSALLGRLLETCEAGGCRQMVAVISGSDNRASIRLHERFGFRPAGELRSVGFKFGRWIDTVRMQRALGDGDETVPDPSRAPSARL